MSGNAEKDTGWVAALIGKVPAQLLVAVVGLAAAAFVALVGATLDSVYRTRVPFQVANLEFGPKAPTIFTAPEDAIVAFATKASKTDSSKQCPDGWHPFEDGRGRVVVGAGIPDDKDEFKNWTQVQLDGKLVSLPLKSYDPFSTGGEESHILSIPEMPAHTHQYFTYVNGNAANGGSDPKTLLYGAQQTQTSSMGGNQPHSIMPPFIALYYCQKDK